MKQLAVFFISFLFIAGLNAADTRIIGGQASSSDAWPSTVALLSKVLVDRIESGQTGYSASEANFLAQFCGGSLIAEKWVLTAAHCVETNGTPITPESLYILLGTNDLSSGGLRILVERVILHPSYNSVAADADIALLELSSAVTEPATPVYEDDPAAGMMSTVVGWGSMNPLASQYPKLLNEVDLPIVSRTDCANVYQSELTENMFCAGFDEGGKDSCTGDSGGPLYVEIDGVTVQAGIVSWGYECALPNFYGVYTRLSLFDSWIRSTTGVDETTTGPETHTEEHNSGENSSGESSSDENSSGESSSGESSSGESSSGESSSGENSSGENSSGENSSGENSSGENSSGENSSGENSSGENSSGENSSGESSSGENNSGESSSGENSSGESSSGENSSGESSSGENSSGENNSGENSSGESDTSVSATNETASQSNASESNTEVAPISESPTEVNTLTAENITQENSTQTNSDSETANSGAGVFWLPLLGLLLLGHLPKRTTPIG